jgi:hypothetical protein
VRQRAVLLTLAALVTIGLAVPGVAKAQGNGRPKAPRRPSSPSSSPATAPPSTQVSVARSYRQFGTWLDDASAVAKGEGYTSIGAGYWRMRASNQANLPMLGAGVGVSDRMQVSASVPFYRAQFEGGAASGIDDVYVGAKYTLVDPTLTLSEFGLAVSPTMEILSAGNPDGRIHFAVPLSVELRRQPFRVYGSAGVFTRGSFFSGAALEWSSRHGAVLTGSLAQSYSLKEDGELDSLGAGRQRVDVSLGIVYPVGTMAATFVNVGRSLTSIEEGGTSLAVSGGISLRFNMTAN